MVNPIEGTIRTMFSYLYSLLSYDDGSDELQEFYSASEMYFLVWNVFMYNPSLRLKS